MLETRNFGNADPIKQYVWCLRYIDSPIVRFYDEDIDGPSPIYPDGDHDDPGDSIMYYTTDANFNVTGVVDEADGDVVDRYQYDPYGRVTWLDGEDWSTNMQPDNTNLILFAGYRYSPTTGLYHARNRYYHPTLAVWLTRDPTGYPDGMNAYEYVGGNPTGRADPQGTDFIAVADRPVPPWWVRGIGAMIPIETPLNARHYALLYYRSQCPLASNLLNRTDGWTEDGIRTLIYSNDINMTHYLDYGTLRPGANSGVDGGLELLGDAKRGNGKEWHVWAQTEKNDVSYVDYAPSKQYAWEEVEVYIGWVHYNVSKDDVSKSRIMPIFTEEDADAVRAKWDEMIQAGKDYAYAEQAPLPPEGGWSGEGNENAESHWVADTTSNWPNSHYALFGTNSNTFVRHVVREAGLDMVEMDGSHPGDHWPSLNGPPKARLRFSAEHTPWRVSGEATPKPPDDELPARQGP